MLKKAPFLAAIIFLAASCDNKTIAKPPAITINQLDVIKSKSSASLFMPLLKPLAPHTIGQITWHAKDFLNQTVKIQGYLLKKETGYVIFSDEAAGPITSHDLPVVGSGTGKLQFKQKYILEGKFVAGGLQASNNNPNHLELLNMSQSVK